MLFAKHENEELVLILDVQSSVVRGSVVKLNGAKESATPSTDSQASSPQVLFTCNSNIPYKRGTDSNYLIKTTLKAIKDAVEASLRHLHSLSEVNHKRLKITAVHYALSSPWTVSMAKSVSMTFPENREITKALVQKMVDDERAKIAPNSGDDVKVIEEKVFDIRLNGYSVSAWEGMKAKDLEVSFTVGVAGSRMADRFVESVAHAVRADKVFFHSSLLLQQIGLQKAMPESDAYAMIYIHGELTDIAIVGKHASVFFGSFPWGVRTFIRKLAMSSGTDEHAADSLLALYTAKHLEGDDSKGNIAAIENLSKGWASEMKKLLAKAGETSLPTHFIVSAWAHDDFFLSILKADYPNTRLDLLALDDLLAHVKFEHGTERRRLTSLYAIAINSFGN